MTFEKKKIIFFFFFFFKSGHVDAGKSTLMGHLLYQLGSVNKRAMHKYEQESKKVGKGSFAYAWVLDETEEERWGYFDQEFILIYIYMHLYVCLINWPTIAILHKKNIKFLFFQKTIFSII